jgi:hypothetical protein
MRKFILLTFYICTLTSHCIISLNYLRAGEFINLAFGSTIFIGAYALISNYALKQLFYE